MMKRSRASVSVMILGVLIASLLPLGCKALNLGGKSSDADEQKSCIDDERSVRELKLDLEGDGATKVRALLEGTVHLREVVSKLDREVASACAAIASDLGKERVTVADAAPAGKRAEQACNEAAKRLASRREKGGVVLLIYPQAPMCTSGLYEHSRCLRECDPNLPPDGAGTSCDPEATSGRCSEKCEGVCLTSHDEECKGACRGVCRGGCDKDFFGKCGGRCNGTCNGSSVSGKCEGTCEGKCSAEADGSCGGICKGKCSGMCLAESKKAACDGTCAGTCSGKFEAERCGSVLAPAEMVPECDALCNAKLSREASCIAGNVDIQVYNSTKAGEGDQIKAALQRGIAKLLEADEGMKSSLDRAEQGLQAAFESVDEVLADDKKAKKQAGACIKSAKDEFDDVKEALKKLREASASVFFAAKG